MKSILSFSLQALHLWSALYHPCADILLTHCEESKVMELTGANFARVINENEMVLVKFYAPWCGHCKALEPEYEKAAKILAEQNSKVVLAKVDAQQETEVADTHEIQGFPTLKFFVKKVPQMYTGGRTSETIVEWIETMTGPAVNFVEDVEKLLEKDPGNVKFVGEFLKKDDEAYQLFESVANSSRTLGKFYAKLGEKQKLYVWRESEGVTDYDGKLEEEELKKFFDTESLPLFGPINGENFRKYSEKTTDMLWFCGSPSEFDIIKSAMREAGRKMREKYSFVYLDTDKFKSHAENALGVTEFPAVVLQTRTFRYVFPEFKKTLESDEILTFLKDVESGNISPSLKSEAPPATNDGDVKIVVGKTFEEMVFDNSKDVLLEVYAPWCGHCKKLKPIYEEFAKKMSVYDNIRIAQMDGTANESPVANFYWSGFPTLYFVKAGTKIPIKFDGTRSVDGFTEFVKKHTSFDNIKEEQPSSAGKTEEL